MTSLLEQHCRHQTGPALTNAEAIQWLAQIPSWEILSDPTCIQREFRFGNYHETMAFVNAAAWIAHREDHHPDMEVSYNRCVVKFATHSVGGLSLNDFICAARVNALLAVTPA
jgi:4a-hydroxytetrahydrobiopterin dehydratase